jgi:hypothetical protein
MTDAPDKIWVHYEVETDDATWSEYSDTDGFADFKHYGEYIRADIFQARITELEAVLKLITHRAEMSIGYNDDFFNFGWIVKKARAALKAKP